MSYYLYDDDFTPRWVLKLVANAHGGGGSSPPSLQNPAITSNYQQSLNTGAGLQSQSGSMVNQNNWLGSLGYQQTGTDQYGNPIYSSSLQLSPAQQQLYNTLTGTQQAAGQEGQSLINNANYGAVNPTEAIGNETSGIQGSLMDQWLQSQTPWLSLQDQQLDTQLRNQGLDPGSPAYQNQMKQLEQAQEQGVAGAASQFEPTAFSEATSLYTLPAQLGLQLAQFGQYTSPGNALVQTPGLNISPANYEGDVNAYNQAQEAAYQAQQQSQGNMISGLFSGAGNIGGALLRAAPAAAAV